MCTHVTQAESVSTVLGVLSHLYAKHPSDATLLMDLFSKECNDRGAADTCVLGSLLSASVYVTMTLMGEQGDERVRDLNMWWSAQCLG